MILQLQKVFFVYTEQHLFTFVLHTDQLVSTHAFNLIGSTQGMTEFFLSSMVICLIQQGIHKGCIDNFEIGIYIYSGKLKALLSTNVLNDITAALLLVGFCSWQLRKRHQKWCSCDIFKDVCTWSVH